MDEERKKRSHVLSSQKRVLWAMQIPPPVSCYTWRVTLSYGIAYACLNKRFRYALNIARLLFKTICSLFSSESCRKHLYGSDQDISQRQSFTNTLELKTLEPYRSIRAFELHPMKDLARINLSSSLLKTRLIAPCGRTPTRRKGTPKARCTTIFVIIVTLIYRFF